MYIGPNDLYITKPLSLINYILLVTILFLDHSVYPSGLAGGLAGWPQSGGHCLLHDVWSWNFQYEWEVARGELVGDDKKDTPGLVNIHR